MRRTRPLLAASVALATTLSTERPALAQDAPDVGELAGFVRWGGVLLSLFVIGGIIVFLRVTGTLANSLSGQFASRRLLIQKLESIIRFLTYVVGAVVCLGLSIRLDPTALTVIGGALAFAIGFAMRDLVAAFIAGITIMFDRPFQVGDRVEYAGQYGDIIQIGLRSVRMNTLDHNVITIPNNKVLTDVTSSGNYGALEMQVPMDFYIGVDQDVRVAQSVIQEACLTSRYVFLGRPVPVLVKQVLLSNVVAVHLKARPYVLDTKYEKAFETDVHIRVMEAFTRRGVRPPAVLYRPVDAPAELPPRARPSLPAS
ncbi:MAG: mechanosensitive ion channel [Polyangiaceae bacterium]|nr:mechanosensitive ion channel [Polyangiaceae bacterium]